MTYKFNFGLKRQDLKVVKFACFKPSHRSLAGYIVFTEIKGGRQEIANAKYF